MPSQSGALNPSQVAGIPRSRPLLATKAARKHYNVADDNGGDASSGRSVAAGGNNGDDHSADSDSSRRYAIEEGHQQPNLATKSKRRVAFRIEEDSAGDNEERHVGPSHHRGHRKLATKSDALFPPSPEQRRPESAQSGRRAGHQSRRPLPNPLDEANYRPAKHVQRRRLDKVELDCWTGKYARKEYGGGGRRYSRMTIGGTPRSVESLDLGRGGHRNDHGRKYYIDNGVLVCHPAQRTSEGTSTNDSEEESDSEPTRPLNVKAARKLQVGQVGVKSNRRPRGPQQPVSTASSDAIPPPENPESGMDESDESEDLVHGAAKDDILVAARGNVVESPSDSGAEEPEKPTGALIEALERVSLTSVRLQKMRRLPFLRRNLRAGYIYRCRLVGVDVKEQALPHRSVTVAYSCAPRIGGSGIATSNSASTSMKSWLCPLCNLHGTFANQKMLNTHLSWDHRDVEASWSHDYSLLSVAVHTPISKPLAYRFPVREPSETASDFSSNLTHVGRRTDTPLDEKVPDRFSTTPSVTATESTLATTVTSDTIEDIKPKWSPSRYSSQAASDSSRRSSSAPRSSTSRQDGLGPSAVYPYLPQSSGKGDVYYSCRPGGPRLYDILNPLSLEPYGVLKWVVVDREEELFELDDILDEDKVMLALWYRWIFLNRNKFVASYFNGAKAFVKENWELIKQGAGLLALRNFLLVLCVNNFLLPLEIVTLMRYYQELAGIQMS